MSGGTKFGIQNGFTRSLSHLHLDEEEKLAEQNQALVVANANVTRQIKAMRAALDNARKHAARNRPAMLKAKNARMARKEKRSRTTRETDRIKREKKKTLAKCRALSSRIGAMTEVATINGDQFKELQCNVLDKSIKCRTLTHDNQHAQHDLNRNEHREKKLEKALGKYPTAIAGLFHVAAKLRQKHHDLSLSRAKELGGLQNQQKCIHRILGSDIAATSSAAAGSGNGSSVKVAALVQMEIDRLSQENDALKQELATFGWTPAKYADARAAAKAKSSADADSELQALRDELEGNEAVRASMQDKETKDARAKAARVAAAQRKIDALQSEIKEVKTQLRVQSLACQKGRSKVRALVRQTRDCKIQAEEMENAKILRHNLARLRQARKERAEETRRRRAQENRLARQVKREAEAELERLKVEAVARERRERREKAEARVLQYRAVKARAGREAEAASKETLHGPGPVVDLGTIEEEEDAAAASFFDNFDLNVMQAVRQGLDYNAVVQAKGARSPPKPKSKAKAKAAGLKTLDEAFALRDPSVEAKNFFQNFEAQVKEATTLKETTSVERLEQAVWQNFLSIEGRPPNMLEWKELTSKELIPQAPAPAAPTPGNDEAAAAFFQVRDGVSLDEAHDAAIKVQSKVRQQIARRATEELQKEADEKRAAKEEKEAAAARAAKEADEKKALEIAEAQAKAIAAVTEAAAKEAAAAATQIQKHARRHLIQKETKKNLHHHHYMTDTEESARKLEGTKEKLQKIHSMEATKIQSQIRRHQHAQRAKETREALTEAKQTEEMKEAMRKNEVKRRKTSKTTASKVKAEAAVRQRFKNHIGRDPTDVEWARIKRKMSKTVDSMGLELVDVEAVAEPEHKTGRRSGLPRKPRPGGHGNGGKRPIRKARSTAAVNRTRGGKKGKGRKKQGGKRGSSPKRSTTWAGPKRTHAVMIGEMSSQFFAVTGRQPSALEMQQITARLQPPSSADGDDGGEGKGDRTVTRRPTQYLQKELDLAVAAEIDSMLDPLSTKPVHVVSVADGKSGEAHEAGGRDHMDEAVLMSHVKTLVEAEFELLKETFEQRAGRLPTADELDVIHLRLEQSSQIRALARRNLAKQQQKSKKTPAGRKTSRRLQLQQRKSSRSDGAASANAKKAAAVAVTSPGKVQEKEMVPDASGVLYYEPVDKDSTASGFLAHRPDGTHSHVSAEEMMRATVAKKEKEEDDVVQEEKDEADKTEARTKDTDAVVTKDDGAATVVKVERRASIAMSKAKAAASSESERRLSLRKDPEGSGDLFTKEEFIDFYGGEEEWNAAGPSLHEKDLEDE